MIAIATPAPARINLPTFRQGWTTAQGKVKAGFWMFRYNGKYVSLTAYGAPAEAGKTKTDLRRNEALAVAARDKYLASLSLAQEKSALAARIKANEVVTVWHVCKAYVDFKLPESSPRYRQQATAILNQFCKGHAGNEPRKVKPYAGWGKLPAEDMHEGVIADWASHHAWGISGLRSSIVPLKAAFAFAAGHNAQGIRANGKIKPLIVNDPLRTYKARTAAPRADVFSAEQENTFRDAAKANPALLEIASALLELGARPNELRCLCKRPMGDSRPSHFDATAGEFVLQPDEWKNGRKTRRCRYIGLSPKWIEWAKGRLADMQDGDFFFVDRRGKAWTKGTFNGAWRKVIAKAALPATHVPYVARHSFITRACGKGIAAIHIANQCGTSPGMIQAVYDKSFRDTTLRANVVNQVAAMQ
jgi:hypothetical protein